MKYRLSAIAMLLALLFTSCMKDKSLKTFTLYRPVYTIKPIVKEKLTLQKPEPLNQLGSFALYKGSMLINERGKGIHVVDYSNPASPVNKGFIPIPGNTGVSVRNNVMYADCYSTLFIFSLKEGGEIVQEGEIKNAFPGRLASNSVDTAVVEVTWLKKDTTVTEEYYNSHQNEFRYDNAVALNSASTPAPANGGGSSVGSSMAVFAIVDAFLYTVDHSNLTVFSLSDPLKPTVCSNQLVPGSNVETVFPFADKLFIGSMTGMSMYSLTDRCKPAYLSQYQHVRVCDPVIADEKFAYVTLRSGGGCGGAVNRLDILDIENVTDPKLIASYPFSNPHGLSKDGNVLFLCDGSAGLRVLDAADVKTVNTIQTLAHGTAIDVIAMNQLAVVMFSDAIRFYSYDQQFNISPVGSVTKNQ